MDKQLQSESCRGGSRVKMTETHRRGCRTSGETGYNLRTCQIHTETLEEDSD